MLLAALVVNSSTTGDGKGEGHPAIRLPMFLATVGSRDRERTLFAQHRPLPAAWTHPVAADWERVRVRWSLLELV